MKTPKKRTPAEAWDALEKMALEDETERVLALDDEDLDRELAGAGIDPQKVRAKGAAIAAKLGAAAVMPAVEVAVKSRPPARKRWVMVWAAATLAAGAGTVAVPTVLVPLLRHGPIVPDSDAAIMSDSERAAVLRRNALLACNERRWAECLQGLNVARALDPVGERDPDIARARKAAQDAMEPPSPGAAPIDPDRKDWKPR